MKSFITLLTFLAPTLAFADSPVIWGNNNLSEFLTNGWYLSDGKQFKSSSVSPSAGAGVTASVGSIIVRDNAGVGELWLKSGALDTAWTNISGSSPSPSPTSSAVSALTKDIAQALHGFSVGDVLYVTGSSYAKANADSDTTAEVVGVVSAVADAGNFTLTTSGYISGLSGLVAGTTYFLSDSVAGALTATEPSTVNHISKPVLIATSATTGFVIQSRGAMIESGGGSITETQEVPTGLINGVNQVFTLAHTPINDASVKLYQSGFFMRQGIEYTIAGSTITMTIAPAVGQVLDITYEY